MGEKEKVTKKNWFLGKKVAADLNDFKWITITQDRVDFDVKGYNDVNWLVLGSFETFEEAKECLLIIFEQLKEELE